MAAGEQARQILIGLNISQHSYHNQQGEDGGRQVGYRELAGGGVLEPHRGAEHDDEAIAVVGFIAHSFLRPHDPSAPDSLLLRRCFVENP